MDLNLSARNRRARERLRHRLCRYLQGTHLQAHFVTRDHVNSYIQSSLHTTTIYEKVLLIYSWKLSTFLFSSSFIPHFSLFMRPVSMPTELEHAPRQPKSSQNSRTMHSIKLDRRLVYPTYGRGCIISIYN